LGSGADIVCLDIEDAVAPTHKSEARAKCLALFADLPDAGAVEPMLRINPMGSEEGMRDVLAIIEATRPPPALMMTKVKAGAEVAMLDELLGENHAHVRLHVIIETNEGLENAYAIGQASGRIDSLLFGGYDMSAELRVEPEWDALLYARARVAHAAAGAGVDLIDVPHLDLDDMDGLAIAARKARQLGFTGKAAIHPKQIEVINTTFSPSEEQIAEAKRIVAAFEKEGASGLLVVDGKLIEAPVLRSMQRTLAVAERIGAR
ncbi:MAG: CoA ester lyase, partial [Alphaproteobacteria bacterium]|nr:CoA ester lyase [Alphaproteobacteria bacterium]